VDNFFFLGVSSFSRLESVFGCVSFIKFKILVKKHVSKTFLALQIVFCTDCTISVYLLLKDIFKSTMQFDVCNSCYRLLFSEIL
jgi:hypothetical protein